MAASIDVRALLGDLAEQEPGVHRAAAQIAWQLRWQGYSCWRMGSPLYALLLAGAADDTEAGGPCWQVLRGHLAPGRGDALALRFMAAVHRLVLTGQATELARHYPSAGGSAVDDPREVFLGTVETHGAALADDVSRPCQTNEVGRAAALVFGFLDVAAAGLPLRLLEIGASAGLNLRWDRFRYGGGGGAWGPEHSPVDLTGHWVAPPAHTGTQVTVAGRGGCDPRPVDPTSADGRLLVTSSVWADQADRHARLEGAFTLAAALPAPVDAASADDWLEATLRPETGIATVVYQSIMEEYLPEEVRRRVHRTIESAGSKATRRATVHWVRMEPESLLRTHAVTLTSWPGGEQRLLAVCGAHGRDVRPAAPTGAR